MAALALALAAIEPLATIATPRDSACKGKRREGENEGGGAKEEGRRGQKAEGGREGVGKEWGRRGGEGRLIGSITVSLSLSLTFRRAMNQGSMEVLRVMSRGEISPVSKACQGG